MNRTYIFILVCLTIIGSVSLYHFLSGGGSFQDNILPELVGFSLDGIFFAILFTYYEKHREQKARLQEKKNLKESLIGSLGLLLYWACPVDSKHRKKIAFAPPDSIKGLIEDLKKAGELREVQPLFLRDFAKLQTEMLISLLPIAAAIDHKHLESWSLIINNLRGIRDSKTDKDCYDSLMMLLTFLSVFESEEIDV